jgi:hypothetical protein
MIQSLSIKFYLNGFKAKGNKLPIYLRITKDRKKSEVATGYFLEEKSWDGSYQRAKKNTEINEHLSSIESQVYEIAIYERGFRLYKSAFLTYEEKLNDVKLFVPQMFSSINAQYSLLEAAYNNGFKKCGFLLKQIYEEDYRKATDERNIQFPKPGIHPSEAKNYLASIKKWNQRLEADANPDYLYSRALTHLGQSKDSARVSQTVKWLNALSLKNDNNAKIILYQYYSSLGNNSTLALSLLQELAKAGDREAMFLLAVRDYKAGISNASTHIDNGWMQAAAQKGHTLAMLNYAEQFASKDVFTPGEYNISRYWFNRLKLNGHEVNPDYNNNKTNRVEEQFWSDWANNSDPLVTQNYYDEGEAMRTGGYATASGWYKEYDQAGGVIVGFVASAAKFGLKRLAQLQSAEAYISQIDSVYSTNTYTNYGGAMTADIHSSISVNEGQKIFLFSDGEISFKSGNSQWQSCGTGGAFTVYQKGNLTFKVDKNPDGFTRSGIIVNVIQ